MNNFVLIKIMFDMRKIILLLVTLLACSLSYAQGPEYSPVWAESGNLDFITVGNTNHKLIGINEGEFPQNRDSEIKNGKIEAIVNGKNAFTNSSSIKNVNFKEFRISKPKAATCEGTLKIKKAFLSWGGRSPKTTGKDEVLIAITEGTTKLGEAQIKGTLKEADLYGYDKKLYTCHADVTAEVNSILGNTPSQDAVFRIYVANVETESDESTYASNGVRIGNYSGWTFTVIYEYSGLPERSIFYYQPDKVSDVVTTDASQAASPTLFNLKLDMANIGLDLSQGTVLSIASLGGTYSIEDDQLVCNKTGTEKLKELDDYGGGKTTIVKNGDKNSFSSTVTYEYLFADGNNIESNSNRYTRGYDLHAVALSGGDVTEKILTKDRTSFNIAIAKSDDPHHTTDILLMFGEPNMPEVVLKDEATPDVKPGETFTYTLTVGLNQNSVIFRNFELCVPFSDYVDYFEDVSITFAKKKGSNDMWEPKPYPSKGLVYLNTDGLTDTPIGNETNRWPNWKSTKGTSF